jgi:BirA family biotin operon repressor/biotin-[acetyl-CoA-carboxylase] ligase
MLKSDSLLLVTADEQSAGRGQFEREWLSPPSENIYATFGFLLNKPQKELGVLTQLLALTACYALEEYGFTPLIKWPNDLLIDGNKIGGILCEVTDTGDTLAVAIGIGLNINSPKERFENIDQPAASLFTLSGEKFEIQQIIQHLSEEFKKQLLQYLQHGSAPFQEALKHRLAYTGEEIIVQAGDRKFSGTQVNINSDGSLVVQLRDQTLKTIYSGRLITRAT